MNDDVLLTKLEYKRVINRVIVAAGLTMAVVMAFPKGDVGWIQWDFIAWAGAYPLKFPFFIMIVIFMVLGKYAFNMPLTMQSSTWELPDVLLERPRSYKQAIKTLIQALTLLAGLIGIYLGFLVLLTAIFNLIHSRS